MSTVLTPDARRLKALKRFALTSSLITLLGHAVLGFEQPYITPLVGVFTAYAVDLLLEWASARQKRRPARFSGGATAFWHFLLPAHIVGLTCSMFLYPGGRLMPIAFAAALSIATKHVIKVRIQGKLRHFLNPSNAGLLATMVIFKDVGIVLPYQFHSGLNDVFDVVLPAAIFLLGTLLNARITRRIPLIAGWLISFVAQAVARFAVFGDSLPAMLGLATGTVALMFTFYMVTDPGTTPERARPQFIFGAAVGSLYGVFVAMHLVFALFWALVAVCSGRAVIHVIQAKTKKRPPEVKGVDVTPSQGLPMAG